MIAELTILIILLIFSVPPLLVRKFSNDKYLKRPFWQFNDYNPLVLGLLGLPVAVIFLNNINPQPDLSTADKKIDFGKRRGISQYEQVGYESKMLADQKNLLYHFKAIEARSKNLTSGKRILDETFFDKQVSDPEYYYNGLLKSNDKDLRDAGHFGIAALYILRDYLKPLAESNISEISDQEKPCVHYLKALLFEREDTDSAIYHYKKEIESKGNVEQSVARLSSYYFHKQDFLSLRNLNENALTHPFLDIYYKLAFKEGHYLEFLELEFAYCFTKWNISGVIGAFLIFLIWIFYIMKVDLFEKEKMKHVLFVVLSSCVLTLLISYYYHYEHHYLGISKSSDWLNNLFYYVVGVGFTEEVFKIIPVLFLLAFTKAINEPLDYIVFGSLSALSFAFVENTLYFDEDGIYNIHGRALWTSISHAADTCIITYCLMYPKWHPSAKGWMKNTGLMFTLGLVIASVSHGVYDFFCMKQFQEVWIVRFLIVLTSIVVYTSMINNGLNNSPFYLKNKILNTDRLGALLATLLLGIIVFEYICISVIYGIETGNECLIMSLLTSWYLLMFLTVRLTGLDIFPGRWARLKFLSSINPVAMILFKQINYANYIGKDLVINGGRRDATILKYLPIKGKIIRREAIEEYTGWLVLEIDKPIIVGRKEYRQIWIRSSQDNVPMLNNPNAEAKICVLPEAYKEKIKKTEADLIYIDRVLVS
jgi:protease PrsW